MFIHPRSSLENPTRFQTEMGSVYPFSDQNGGKTLPDGAAHSFYGLYKAVPLRAETQEIFWECMLPNPPRNLAFSALVQEIGQCLSQIASEQVAVPRK